MQILIYTFLAGAIVASLVAAVVVGGVAWIAPVVALAVTGGFAAYDRQLKRKESREERLASEIHPD